MRLAAAQVELSVRSTLLAIAVMTGVSPATMPRSASKKEHPTQTLVRSHLGEGGNELAQGLIQFGGG
jgi:hypothetical protein